MREFATDVLIVGGGVGGVAAALALADRGVPFIMTEPTDWIGGQLTAQAVPPDENRWVETFGATRRYQSLRSAVRARYRSQPLRPEFLADELLNPGGGWVSRLCAEPRVWHRELLDMLARATGDAALPMVRTRCRPTRAVRDGDFVRAIEFSDHGQASEALVISAKYILDATELGDVYHLAGIEHSIGSEHTSVYNELHGNPDRTDPTDQQACSWCFAIEHRPGEDHTITRPPRYEWWRAYIPRMQPPWCGPLFSWTVPSHNTEGRRTFAMMPWPAEPAKGEMEMWRYRRIARREIYTDAAAADHPDVALINMVQMDYWQRPLLGVDAVAQDLALAEAREQSLAFLYWMQTEAPRYDTDARAGYPGLRLRGDELGTPDGMAKACYIREPRRLLARTMVTEGHIGTDQRRAAGLATEAMAWSATPSGTAERFADSVGIGHYMIDLHPSTAGRNNVYVPCAPFRIPMGALIPLRVRNVLGAGKAIGVSHVTNGAFRMHPTEWNNGEAAGTLAAWCLSHDVEPHQVHEFPEHIRLVRQALHDDGVRTEWPWEQD